MKTTIKNHTRIRKGCDGKYHAYYWQGDMARPDEKYTGHWHGFGVGYDTKREAMDAVREWVANANEI